MNHERLQITLSDLLVEWSPYQKCDAQESSAGQIW